jgi:hypothetical protein
MPDMTARQYDLKHSMFEIALNTAMECPSSQDSAKILDSAETIAARTDELVLCSLAWNELGEDGKTAQRLTRAERMHSIILF